MNAFRGPFLSSWEDQDQGRCHRSLWAGMAVGGNCRLQVVQRYGQVENKWCCLADSRCVVRACMHALVQEPPLLWLDAWVAASLPVLGTFSGRDLASALDCFNRLQYQPDPAWMGQALTLVQVGQSVGGWWGSETCGGAALWSIGPRTQPLGWKGRCRCCQVMDAVVQGSWGEHMHGPGEWWLVRIGIGLSTISGTPSSLAAR